MKFSCRAWIFEPTCFSHEKSKTVLDRIFEANEIQSARELALDWIQKYHRENMKFGYTLFVELRETELDIGNIMTMCSVNFPSLSIPDSEQSSPENAVESQNRGEKNKFAASEKIRELLKPVTFFVSVEKGIYYVLKFLSIEECKPVSQTITEAIALYIKKREDRFGEELAKFVKELIERSTKENK